VDIPPPPRSGASFRPFYERERARMIALVGAMSGDRIYDPEQIAENGWHRFHPYWKDCDNPEAYLRRCVVNVAWDELRAVRDAPRIDLIEPGDNCLVEDLPCPAPPLMGFDPWDRELADALASLSDKLRAVVVLDTELNPGERSAAEIAEILQINRMTAHMRLKRAYARLRQILPDGYLEERQARLRATGGLEERSAT
jgi:DNA-directed RNA polymerase specialized sigma24 family protein